MGQTAKLFWNGKSQAVRLPLSYRFEGNEVCIQCIPIITFFKKLIDSFFLF